MKTNETINTESYLISYLTLRKAVGFLGFGLPIVLALGSFIIKDCTCIQSSISNYYHTGMRDMFVGVLCAISLFLFTYKGYDNRDNITASLASLFALGIAFFPTTIDTEMCCIIDRSLHGSNTVIENPSGISVLHFTFAALFFVLLSYFSLCLFTITEPSVTPITFWGCVKDYFRSLFLNGTLDASATNTKKAQIKLFRVCGRVIFGSIILIALYSFYLEENYPFLKDFRPVFWLETIALWAFALSWLTKGKLLLRED